MRHGTFITILALKAALPLAATAAPVTSVVAAGTAAISAGANTSITQSSNRVVINWKDFNTTGQEGVKFHAPDAKIVTQGAPSAIHHNAAVKSAQTGASLNALAPAAGAQHVPTAQPPADPVDYSNMMLRDLGLLQY